MSEEKVEPIDISAAYVDPEERVVDPSLLDQSLVERMPQPRLSHCGCPCCENGARLLCRRKKIRRQALVRRKAVGDDWQIFRRSV